MSFIGMVVLTALVGALIFMVIHEGKDTGFQNDDTKMLYLAEAGVERAMREIRNDYSTTTQTGIAHLRGSDTSASIDVLDPGLISYQEDGSATLKKDTDVAFLKTFDANYTNTRIIKVELGVLASYVSGGLGATLEVSYTTTGVFPQVGNAVLTQALTTTPTYYFADITADRAWSWEAIMSSNFTLRAMRTAGNRNITLDYLFLRVTYGIDTAPEAWSTGSYQVYPITLGAGTVQSVSITAEQGKVHLNTASQALLRYLMVENGTADATANTVATAIVNYRAGNLLDTIEELQQVTGVTSTIYNAIDQDITVCSYISPYAQQPDAARASININTASQAVLRAIFTPITFSSSSDITDLASAIITQRAAAPFTCFYSADALITTDFFDFVRAQSYLSNAEDDSVLGNADASDLVPRSGGNQEDAITTEFSYDTNGFKVESVGRVNSRDLRIKTVLSNQGTRIFTNYTGDTSSVGTRQENFE